MDHLLKCIQRVHPAAICSWEFFLLHNNVPTDKSASVCQFLTPKNVTTLYHPPILSRFISTRLFSVLEVETEVKRTPLCECCWDPRTRNWWIKEGPKRGIFGSFSENVRPHKSLYICQWSLFWIKKKGMCLQFLKKISPKTFGWYCIRLIHVVWKLAVIGKTQNSGNVALITSAPVGHFAQNTLRSQVCK